MLPLGEELLTDPRKTPRWFPTVAAAFPELNLGLQAAGDSIANCFLSLCHLGPFLKTNKTDIEKIPRVLLFLATHHEVYCFKKSMKSRGNVYSQSGYCSLYKCY